MNRDEMQLRDRLLLLAECSNPHRPFNVKRKPLLTRQTSSKSNNSKLSVQDFVRMDPGYTPDIEHLVFPSKKRSPQQVAPAVATGAGVPQQATSQISKSRSRLVEMFALSRHLHQKSIERENKSRIGLVNRSVDSALSHHHKLQQQQQQQIQQQQIQIPADRSPSFSSVASCKKWASASSEPKEFQQQSQQQQRISPAGDANCLSSSSSVKDNNMTLRGHNNISIVHLRSTSEPWDPSPAPPTNTTYPISSRNHPQPPKTAAHTQHHPASSYHRLTKHQSLSTPQHKLWTTSPIFRRELDCNDEIYPQRELSPVKWYDREVDGVYLGKSGWVQVQQRSLDDEKRSSYIGSKLARSGGVTKPRTTPKLINYHFNSEPDRPHNLTLLPEPESHDSPPPITPIISPPPAFQDKKTISPVKRTFFPKTPFLPRSNAIEDSDETPPITPQFKIIPQTKSLEDSRTQKRRMQFWQHYQKNSSSSSSSSMGFRSLDSTFKSSAAHMPRLSENTDADDEDNNSSINISMKKIIPYKPPQLSSPSSTSSNEMYPKEEQVQRVRRSRSLQLPEKKMPPTRTSPTVIKIDSIPERPKRHPPYRNKPPEDLMREAEIVTNYFRSRNVSNKTTPAPGEITVYYVGGNNNKQKILTRNMTSPMLETPPININKPPAHYIRPSQTYPTHVKSVEEPRRKQRVNPNSKRMIMSNSPSPSNEWRSSFKGSGASTPVDDLGRSRPGSAASEPKGKPETVLGQGQRSMSLPKSFLSSSYQPGGTILWQRHGTEKAGSSPPGPSRKTPSPETSHTAPVTPLHEGNRRRSPVNPPTQTRVKASSTPLLLDNQTGNWTEEDLELVVGTAGIKETETTIITNPQVPAQPSESVLQKFKKSLHLRFQNSSNSKKVSSKTSSNSTLEDNSQENESENILEVETAGSSGVSEGVVDEVTVKEKDSHNQPQQEQKPKFGSLIWRSGKDKKKLNKALRSSKCNSGDSGIQIEMAPGGVGTGYGSDANDQDGAGDELDSPTLVGRWRLEAKGQERHHRSPTPKTEGALQESVRQIPAHFLKADLKYNHRHSQQNVNNNKMGGSSVRRTCSDRRADVRDYADAAQCAQHNVMRRISPRSGIRRLRRSLSQPVDIDKIMECGQSVESRLNRPLPPATTTSSSEDLRTTSNSESSLTSLSEPSLRPPSANVTPNHQHHHHHYHHRPFSLAEAVFDHVVIDPEELAFHAGDVIKVMDCRMDDWWWGMNENNAKFGWFPSHFVRLRIGQEREDEREWERVRAGVVRELVGSEREFVKVLRDVNEGFVRECRKRVDMFDEEKIAKIFGNLEDILRFQEEFLKELETEINWESLHKSKIGKCFLKNHSKFLIYSIYCNSHPIAISTLQDLYQKESYRSFFEACRLMRGLMEIPLDGYLLTPVQRICKYPLQLGELLKYTSKDHEDYDDVKEALRVMKGVAMLVNERKRRMESLEKLARWQQRVEGWEGEDLVETSSQLVHHGEVVRVRTGMWTNSVNLFLFDGQIVYCKKDLLKRNSYVYKDRILLEHCDIINVPDGKDPHLNVTLRHAIKVVDKKTDKFLLFCCRSANNKQKWLTAFERERKIVEENKEREMELPQGVRKMAMMAAKCKKEPIRKIKSNNKSDPRFYSESNSNSLGRRVGGKVGNWFGFKKASRRSHHNHPHHLQDVS